MSTGTRPDLDPVLRRAFMAPVIAEWTRVLGKSLIVSTTEDDETAAANCAVEVVMTVEGAVRGKVIYTLPPQTVLAIATAPGNANPEAAERDPLPSVEVLFKPIAIRAREMLQSSGLGSSVSLKGVNDVRGNAYAIPVSSSQSVHMVTQPVHKDPSSPQPVSVWFELEVTAAPTPVPQAVGAQRADARSTAREDHAGPVRGAAQPGPARSAEQRPPAAPDSRQASTPPPAGGQSPSPVPARPGGDQSGRGPGYPPVVRTGRLEIVDETGTARAVVSTLADGSPHIVFADRDGRIRAAISLARDGQPRILFLDEMGRRILDLPHLGSSTHIASQQQPPSRPGSVAPQAQGQQVQQPQSQGPSPRNPGSQPPPNGRPRTPPPQPPQRRP